MHISPHRKGTKFGFKFVFLSNLVAGNKISRFVFIGFVTAAKFRLLIRSHEWQMKIGGDCVTSMV